jgi:hypothetical protein
MSSYRGTENLYLTCLNQGRDLPMPQLRAKYMARCDAEPRALGSHRSAFGACWSQHLSRMSETAVSMCHKYNQGLRATYKVSQLAKKLVACSHEKPHI